MMAQDLGVSCSGVSPFVKWVGGKRGLLSEILPRVPQKFGAYYEPFLGGGAVFFAIHHRAERAYLSDVNLDLVRAYRAIRDDVHGVIATLREWTRDKAFYLELRARTAEGESDAFAAARFVYLLKCGFNGLWRVNRAGGFNVPFGKNTAPVLDAETLHRCSSALQGVSIEHEDFRPALLSAREGDFVYADPPYVPVSATSDFASYAAGGFGVDDQRRLANVARLLGERGVRVLLSNSGAPFVRELYADGFEVHEVAAARAINSKVDRRGKVGELLIETRAPRAMLRARDGRYVKECAFCGCPDGCACDGAGCPCGTSKAAP